MRAPVFIGDEVTAAGFRLAGAQTVIPAAGSAGAVFSRALGQAGLVIITAACAAELPDAQLDRAMRKADPLVLVVPDAAGRVWPADLGAEVDRVLGIQT